MCIAPFGTCAQIYTHACVYIYVLVLKWLPSKWNVPRRPWFYKEPGGGWERDKKSIRVGREEEKVVNSHGLSLTTGAVSCCVGLVSVAV